MELVNGSYVIQNVNVLDICAQFGTPVYVYDAEKIVGQLRNLKAAFSGVDLKIKYAAKALTNLSVLKLLRKHGADIDVVSVQEAQLALKAGYLPSEIMFTPNCAEFEELTEGAKAGFTLNIDNLPHLKKFGEQFGSQYPCCLRLNPHIMAGGNLKISTGHSNSKFGISVYQIPQIMEIVDQYKINVTGLHIHTGSEISEADVFIKMAEIFFSVAREFKDLRFIDFGSGFKVAYQEGDAVTNVYDLGLKLTKAFTEFCAQYGRKLELWIEPGKYIVSDAGNLLVKTTVVKSTPHYECLESRRAAKDLYRCRLYL
jgi:diaminopimelate decarboxylase